MVATVKGPKLLTVEQTAAALSLSEASVWRLVQSGALPSVRLTRWVTRFDRGDVDKLVDRCRQKGQDDTIEEAMAELDRMDADRGGPLCPRCLKRPRVGIDMCGVCSAEVAELKEEREERDRMHKLNTYHRHAESYNQQKRERAERERQEGESG